jgi:hypothetical protein
MKNLGFDPSEIAQLRKECEEEGLPFVIIVDDEDDIEFSTDFCEVQFVGKYEGKEAIYDAIFYTLKMHHEGLVYDEAEKKVKKIYPNYVSIEERTPSYKGSNEEDDEVELLIVEFMEEIMEEESIKAKESITIDDSIEFGVGIEVILNVEEITPQIIADFIDQYNSGTVKLDDTFYSFSYDDDEEDED